MSNVNLSIGGRSYMVNCAEGEEAHVTELGEMIDAKLASMGQVGSNETRNLLFAALLLADEVYELRSGAPAPVAAAALPEIDAERLEAIAGRLENLAAHLEA